MFDLIDPARFATVHDFLLARGWQFTPPRVRDDGDDGPCGPRYRLRRLCFCHFMRRWMETRVVLHRRRERSDATGCVRSLDRRRVG